MRAKFVLALSILSSGLSSLSPLYGVTPPPASNAGIIDKEIQDQYEVNIFSPTKDIPVLDVDIPFQKFDLPEGISVQINTFIFQGNTIFSDQQLQNIAADYVGKDLKSSDVKEICYRIQKLYAEHGYILSRAYTPVQEIAGGTLTIEVIEGVLGSIEVEGNRYYSTKFIKKYFSSQIGDVVDYNRLLRSLMLINEHMDLNVGAIFKKGKNKGEADLIIVAKDKLPLHIATDYNTYGSYLTTKGRAGLRVDGGNIALGGDKLSLMEVMGFPFDHLDFSNAIYSVPLTANGLRMDLSYLYSGFKVNTLNALHLKGSSNIAGIRFYQAMHRTRRLSTDVGIGFDYKDLLNQQMSKTFSYDKLRVLTFSGRLDYADSYKGRLISDFNLFIGIPNFLGGLSAVDHLCSRKGAGGRFFIANLDVRRLQQLPWDCLLVFSATAQGTLNKIPIAQQIYIGGIDNVRGYPLATALGDNGYYGTLELRAPIPYVANYTLPFSKTRKWKDLFQFVFFTDTGAIFLNGHVQKEQAPSFITSAGLGFRITNLWRFDISYDSGFALTKDHKSSDSIQYLRVALRIL
ncbi:MAG: ShlB/FhaC/HecB family hemolysin secretion/activation protein [Chlamydiae bacterium]|nr:ShlB/FhaC/HecB family hemolysin secretion/activation protein [Chlamydiota bacterium]